MKEAPPPPPLPPAPPTSVLPRVIVKGEVLATLRDNGQLWVRAKSAHLKAGDEVLVVGPALAGTQARELYGTGTLMEVRGTLGRLDESVSVPAGELAFAVLASAPLVPRPLPHKPAAAAPAAAAVVVAAPAPVPALTPPPAVSAAPEAAAPPKPVDDKVLKGSIHLWPAGLELINTTQLTWTYCELRVANWYFAFDPSDVVPAGKSQVIQRAAFLSDRRTPDQYLQQGYALLRCREGAGYIWFGKEAVR
jgi:hypothetical protein